MLEMKVDFFQPLLDIIAGTGFSDPWEVSVADDFGIGIVEAEAMEEFLHRHLLSEGTSVGRFAVGIESALIADADAVGIVVSGVSANLSLRSARVEGAVLGDVVVVADGFETSGEVTGFQVFYREVLGRTGCRAVQYD